MSVRCPICRSKARIASSKEMTLNTRENYHQCLNLNCSQVFVSLLSIVRIVRHSHRQPSRILQPYLFGAESDINCKNNAESAKETTSIKEEFSRLHSASGMNNKECAQYLGISEAAVRDRRRGSFSPRRSEIIALSVYGKEFENKLMMAV